MISVILGGFCFYLAGWMSATIRERRRWCDFLYKWLGNKESEDTKDE